MKKNYFLLVFTFFLSVSYIHSQCGGGRYHNFVFANHKLTSDITYGSNVKSNNQSQSLKLDVYEPLGDTAALRPLVIIAHGGSFVGGSKTGSDVVDLCKDLAKLGYVAASMEYRLGMTSFPFPGPDSTDAGPAVIRGMHDGKAAVRFFRKDVATSGNTYKIDTNNIYFAGVSAGGFIGLHMAYMDKMSEYPAFIDTVAQKGLSGGLEGNSGNPGYSSAVKAVINICGAIGDTAWIKAGDEPVLNLHGNKDNTVPYGSALIKLINTFPIMQVDGSSSIAARANQVGLTHCFKTYWNQDHVPHDAYPLQYDTTLVLMRNFLEHFVCNATLNCNYTSSVVGIEQEFIEEKITAYPNPSSTQIFVDLSAFNGKPVKMEVYDAIGRKIMEEQSISTNIYGLNKQDIGSGVYFIRITADENVYNKKVIFE